VHLAVLNQVDVIIDRWLAGPNTQSSLLSVYANERLCVRCYTVLVHISFGAYRQCTVHCTRRPRHIIRHIIRLTQIVSF